ncbi:MAG: UDP-N-acetylmuramoyl-tripeptide--D-alanyl-D-alanine ligase [Actinobacteria bacterium]|nr:UDP-N-acetylmuramoyl-tripeptide--D-alanyl-D-alanine ligase [Actinomycetota bacterium]NBY15621.1 UDP-N-acetylmuramoyl-tripeptide--D-alanyl-D-alanine ligase [Actinomycetota bacterium]
MLNFTLGQIAQITGGRVVGDADLVIKSVSTDSRTKSSDGLFAAIVGERVDGHDFVAQAAKNGALAALVSREITGPGVVVPALNSEIDPVVYALGKISAHYRAELSKANVIGITGSSGKTSTKDIIGQVLATSGETIAPPGSPNNELGLPLTILSAPTTTKNLVLEMGMRGLGHISYLCEIARPNIAVVTNVGQAHIGEVGSIENIAKAKSEIVQGLGHFDWAVLNHDDPNVIAMREVTSAQVITYGFGTGADIRATNLQTMPDGTYAFDVQFENEENNVRLPLLGEHNVLNALAAIGVGSICGMEIAQICQALSTVKSKSPWRMEKKVLPSGVTIINDAYNANPESMAAALRALSVIAPTGHSWAVLGEMAELGEFSLEQHDAIGRLAVRLDIAHLVVVGLSAKAMYLGALQEGSFNAEAVWFPEFSSACDYILERVASPDVLLFKASRIGRFEELAQLVSESLTDEVSSQ